MDTCRWAMARPVVGIFGVLALFCGRSQGEEPVATVNDPFAEVEEGSPPPFLPVYAGEDAASAAQRITAERGIYEASPILSIARAYKEQLQGQDGFSPAKDLVLRTGGAYMRRAEEAIKEKRFAPAVADCLRALMRPGLDPTATEPMMKKLEHALLRMQRIKEMEEKDAAIENEKYAEQKAEADALAKEWMVILAEDERLWRSVDGLGLHDDENSINLSAEMEPAEVSSIEVPLQTSADSDGWKSRLRVRQGEDASHATFHFCAANGIHNADQVSVVGDMVREDLAKRNYEAPPHLSIRTAAEHLEQGQGHQDAFKLSHAGIQYLRGLQADGLTPEEKEDLSTRLSGVLSAYNASQHFLSAWRSQQYLEVVDAAKALPTEMRSDLVQLIIARAYVHLGKVKEAIASVTSVLNKCDKSGDWLDSEPRLIAAVAGAILALRFGDIDKAKKMYQMVLRNDPEQKYIKPRYKALRSFMRILTDIEELLNQSKNHDVVKAVVRSQEILESVMGKEAAANAGTRLLLFECKAKSAMTFHDDAIEACNTAIQQFENHDNPDPRRIAEAYAWRAEANKRDNSFEDAVADLQVALTKVHSKEYQEQLEQAKEAQDEWNKSEEQKDRRGQSQGTFYINRPIKQMLDLPDNIDELDQETKCKWLKTAFRKMSLRWHPDKAKGGKKRAQRKSAEIGEGKGLLELQWGCKGRRR